MPYILELKFKRNIWSLLSVTIIVALVKKGNNFLLHSKRYLLHVPKLPIFLQFSDFPIVKWFLLIFHCFFEILKIIPIPLFVGEITWFAFSVTIKILDILISFHLLVN